MLRRSTRIQLILFVVITLLGVTYVSAEYVGLTKGLFNDECSVSADFKDSGGIFTNAEVTYRGYTVGQVGEIHIRPNGIRVDLDLDDCSDNKIPADTDAVVANRSVVGEQYVDLVPSDGDGPYFPHGKNLIPQSRTSIPTATHILLRNLNRFVQSVPLDDLRTTVTELGKAFNGRGNDLGSLMDSTSLILQSAQQNLPQTIALINQSEKVLDTQLAVEPALKVWARNLRLLSATLKSSDKDIRRLLDNGPDDLMTVQKFVKDNQTDLGVTLANLATVGNLIVRRLDGVEQVFELYPALAAGGKGVLRPNPNDPGHNYGALGLVLSDKKGRSVNNDPPDCGDPLKRSQGYDGTTTREPSKLGPAAPNVAARCTAPRGDKTNVRGSANIPGGDPVSVSGGGVAYPRVVTKNTVNIDTRLQRTNLGDAGWVALMTASLR